METRPSYSSVRALLAARFQKHLAEKYDDGDFALCGVKLERLAMEAIDAGRPFIHAPFAGRFGMAPALHRRVAHYLRLYAGQPGHDGIEEAERKATNHEMSARMIEGVARTNARTKPPITHAGDGGTATTEAKIPITGATAPAPIGEVPGQRSKPDDERHQLRLPGF